MERHGGQGVDLFLCHLHQLKPMLAEIIAEYLLCSRPVNTQCLVSYNVSDPNS